MPMLSKRVWAGNNFIEQFVKKCSNSKVQVEKPKQKTKKKQRQKTKKTPKNWSSGTEKNLSKLIYIQKASHEIYINYSSISNF